MLTIQNISNIGIKEFHCVDTWWVLYGIDETKTEYRFIFIPMQMGRYDPKDVRLVILNREKTHNFGYRLWTTACINTFVNTNEIHNWQELVGLVAHNKMI